MKACFSWSWLWKPRLLSWVKQLTMSAELHVVLWCICILSNNNLTSNSYNKCLCQETIYHCFLSHLLKVIGYFEKYTSSGWEFILFTAVWMVLYFGLLSKTVWIMQGCFSYCWARVTPHLGIFCFLVCPSVE